MSLLALLLACSGPDRPAGPNVLLLTVDTLRADHLGAYGYDRPTSPHIDELAASGVLFERAVSPRGATWPALTTLHTSWPPVRHGVRENGAPADPAAVHLAEVLGERWRRAALLTNAYGASWEGMGEEQRFDTGEERDAAAADAAERWLGEVTGPFFLWVHLVSPHDPFVVHPGGYDPVDPGYTGPVDDGQGPLVRGMYGAPAFTEADRAAVVARYDAEVAFADAAVGRILAALETSGHAADTLVVLAADHGEELFDHPPYLFHFHSPYDGVLRVPLVFAQPGTLPAGRRVRTTVALADVAPTIAELLGIPPSQAWLGRSLVGALRGRTLPDRPVYAEIGRQVLIVYEGSLVWLENPASFAPPLAPPLQLDQAGVPTELRELRFPIPQNGLWDLDADPTQQVDLARARPADAARLQAYAAAWRRQMGWPGPEAGAEPSLLTREALEAMGYLAP